MMNEMIKVEMVNNGIETITTVEVSEMMEVKHYKILEKLEGTKDGKTVGIIPTLTSCNIAFDDYFIMSAYKDNSGKLNKCYNITILGVKLILDNSRNYKKKKVLYDWYNENIKDNNNVKILLIDREEIDFFKSLESAFLPFNIEGVKQYSVLKYKIDYYLPNLKIAIEFDEGGHQGYTYEQQESRQKQIENKLNCKFIRVPNTNNGSYNIGLILKSLFLYGLIYE